MGLQFFKTLLEYNKHQYISIIIKSSKKKFATFFALKKCRLKKLSILLSLLSFQIISAIQFIMQMVHHCSSKLLISVFLLLESFEKLFKKDFWTFKHCSTMMLFAIYNIVYSMTYTVLRPYIIYKVYNVYSIHCIQCSRVNWLINTVCVLVQVTISHHYTNLSSKKICLMEK